MISRLHWILFIKVNVRVEHSVPDGHEAGVVSDVLGVMEDVVSSVSTEWNKSENTPWEFVSAVTVVSFENSDKSPLHNGEEVKLWTKNEHTDH